MELGDTIVEALCISELSFVLTGLKGKANVNNYPLTHSRVCGVES